MKIPIKLGDRVLVRQSHPGIVRYVGDLDSKYTDDQIYVGVKLDDPGMPNYNKLESTDLFICGSFVMQILSAKFSVIVLFAAHWM